MSSFNEIQAAQTDPRYWAVEKTDPLWTRFLARTIDGSLYTVLLTGFLNPLIDSPYKDLIKVAAVIGLTLVGGFALLDTLQYRLGGNTIGKSLMKLTVNSRDGQSPLLFGQYFRRAYLVWFVGQGFNIGFLSWLTNFWWYLQVTANKLTLWDERCQTRVIGLPMRWMDWLKAIALSLLVFIACFVVAEVAGSVTDDAIHAGGHFTLIELPGVDRMPDEPGGKNHPF